MQQRQLRLGDILDDYCPRERRLTNHAVVAMVGPDVKQVRCTTCDTEHVYKHAKVPRQRRKSDAPAALYAQVLAGGPKRVASDAPAADTRTDESTEFAADAAPSPARDEGSGLSEGLAAAGDAPGNAPGDNADNVDGDDSDDVDHGEPEDVEEGPVHRPLIRATLPRLEGQPPPARPAPDFTIRQPTGRPGRFRPRHPHAGPPMFGNRSGGNTGGFMRGNDGGRSQGHGPNRHHAGRKRSK